MPSGTEKELRAFGYRLSGRRSQLGISREDLAGQCDLSTNALYNLEVGKSEAKASTIRALSLALNCSPQYLLFGEEPSRMDDLSDQLASLTRRARSTLDDKKLAAFIQQSRHLLDMLNTL